MLCFCVWRLGRGRGRACMKTARTGDWGWPSWPQRPLGLGHVLAFVFVLMLGSMGRDIRPVGPGLWKSCKMQER